MDIEEDYTSKTPKKNKIEEIGKIIQVANVKGKKKKYMKVKGPSFEVKEYASS